MRLWLVCALSAVLGACAVAPPVPPSAEATAAWRVRQAQLNRIDAFEVRGRLAISNAQEAWQASIRWRQQADTYEIDLRGPFGSGHMQLVGGARGVLLRTADERVYYAESAEALLYQQTGVRMPVGGLRYWMLGLPDPAAAQTGERLDGNGRLEQLEQDNWQIALARYAAVDGVELPHKLLVDQADVSVRMVVDQWTVWSR